MRVPEINTISLRPAAWCTVCGECGTSLLFVRSKDGVKVNVSCDHFISANMGKDGHLDVKMQQNV